MSDFPARPADVDPSMSLTAIASAYLDASRPLFVVGDGVDLTAGEVASHAVAALAFGTELVSRVESGRWPLACDALSAGASRQQVADAAGVDDFQLLIGLSLWSRAARDEGWISADRYEQVVALLGEEEEEQ